MNISRYRIILYSHLLMIFADFFINTFIDILNLENVLQLMIYVLQDTVILMDIILMFLVFFSTYVFQAGLIWMLISKFRLAIFLSLFYLGLSIGHHVWKLRLTWDDPSTYVWSGGYHALFVIQRTVAVLFYYFYDQTILRLADPRFYKRSEWIQDEISKHT